MQTMMDIAGSAEALMDRNRQALEMANALGITADQVAKLARPRNRFPRISRIRSSSPSMTEIDIARNRLARLR